MNILKEYNPDIELIGSGNTDYGHNLAEQVLKQKENEELEQRAEFENYFAFVNAVNKSRMNIENKFSDRTIKETFLKKYFGYKKLNGFNSLADCPDNAIGDAFKNKYNSALNKMKKYSGEGKWKIKIW